MRPIRIGMVMDPIESIHPKKDTTLAFMLEAQARGWEVAYLTLGDLFLSNEHAEGFIRYVKVYNDPDHWFEVIKEEYCHLKSLDIIFMRKDPPFDIEYIMATYILERAELEGTLVLNKPQSLRDVNEKAFTAWFPQCCPASLFTRSKTAIISFLAEHKKVVIKPTDKMGGQSIFVVAQNDPNTNVIIEEMTRHGNQYVQVQAYVPEIVSHGDKRILLIDGEPVPYGITRLPSPGDHRGNLAVGAKAEGFTLSDRDLWICKQIGPELKKRGLFFVGIDIIGDYLTEINVTSPTGVVEISKIFNIHVAGIFYDALSKKADITSP